MNLKKSRQRIHAKKRAMERYGITFDKKLRQELFNIIQCGKDQIIWYYSHRLNVRTAILNGIRVWYLYDKLRAEIATFLPKNPKECDFDAEYLAMNVDGEFEEIKPKERVKDSYDWGQVFKENNE